MNLQGPNGGDLIFSKQFAKLHATHACVESIAVPAPMNRLAAEMAGRLPICPVLVVDLNRKVFEAFLPRGNLNI